MKTNNQSKVNLFATIGHDDDFLDRRERLLERQQQRSKAKYKEQEREMRRMLQSAGNW